LRGTGVKVSVVAPGYVQTKIFHHAVNRGTDEKTQLSVIPWKLYPAEKAARRILHDVTRGKLEIVFPFHARLTWWLSRNFPGLFRTATLKMIDKHRKLVRE
jgi:short-subunit dehydrogenase